jgi:tRNA 2-thiouridine synthesizing protein C
MDDGVYQIAKNQNTEAINMKNFSRTYRALDGYDVEKLYVERESLEVRGLKEDDLLVDVEVLSSVELGKLMNAQDVVITS